MLESPALLAAKFPVDTLTTPSGVTQLTVALKNGTGLMPPSGGITRPVTVTDTSPCRSTEPVPDVIAHGSPPPVIPRSLTAPTADPVTGVIDSNWINLSPSPSAPALTALTPIRLVAPIAATRNLRQYAMAIDLLEPQSRLRRPIPGRVTDPI